MIDSTEMTVQ